jgi:hypothetical protein
MIELINKNFPYYYNIDFKSFECHMSQEVIENIEFVLYSSVLGGAVDFEKWRSSLIGRHLSVTRLGVSAIIPARRMSGDPETSLGNSITSYTVVRTILKDKRASFDLIVEGDDVVVGSTVPMDERDFVDNGFMVKIERALSPRDILFCGLQFSSAGQFIRDPVKFFLNFQLTDRMYAASNPTKAKGLLRAKALSGLYETPACPLISSACWYVLDITGGIKPIFVHDGYNDYTVVPLNPVMTVIMDETRSMFCDKFNVSPSAQLICEAALRVGDFAILTKYLSFTAEHYLFHDLEFIMAENLL